jgi:hypothetical protein
MRRHFLQAGALAVSAATGPKLAGATNRRQFVLENKQLAWRLDAAHDGVRAVAFENRLSGRRHELETQNDFKLTFATGQRLEIPWWNFRLTDGEDVSPEREEGLRLGFHKPASPAGNWTAVHNLAGGQKGRVYQGFGWFRHEFVLPEEARGRDLFFVLGGCDEQDWNEHWVYLNGGEIGHRTVSGRWRVPGRYAVRPGDQAYASLQFGAKFRNLLAIRARGYDYHVEGLSEEALEQYVFRPFLFDQFISIGEPYLPTPRFELKQAQQDRAESLRFVLEDSARQLVVTAHYELDGFLRRKTLDIRNQSQQPVLLLDVELDAFRTTGKSAEGGHGKPVFLEGEAFCAIEHPAGINQGDAGEVRLWHCPGRTIAPGETLRTLSAVVGAAEPKRALAQFQNYLQARSPRRDKGRISIFTCFGTNNQWGACPTLNDSEVLDDQKVVGSWQAKGVKLDFFTLDTGWPANDGDLTEFVNTCYPDGPAPIVAGIHRLNMRFGLWFSEGWGGWANGSYPAIQPGAIPEPGQPPDAPDALPVAVYRNGFPAAGGVGHQMCMAADAYYDVFRKAVLHHVRENQARLLKFDSGNYYCNSTKHGHLPGKYSTEAISNRVIEIVQAARALAPDVFVMWYWGEGSPFWALHGDVISESGLFMEGSGTSQFPTLYYRDSVTLSLDQNTQFAKLIPPMNKDSLGIWLSQIRWGNFMGKERWREALVMDLGRGSLVFPQLWGDPNLLDDSDVAFLASMLELARNHQQTLLRPRLTFGDSWKNEPYGYAFTEGSRGLIFCHNAHFTARPLNLTLGTQLGISVAEGAPLRTTTHFPERTELVSEKGIPFRVGDALQIWMRPFETLLLEIQSDAANLPTRRLNQAAEEHYGASLALNSQASLERVDLKFADAARFESAGLRQTTQYFSSLLPALAEGRHVLAITVKLSKKGKDYRYSPVVAEIVQLRGRLASRSRNPNDSSSRRAALRQHTTCRLFMGALQNTAGRPALERGAGIRRPCFPAGGCGSARRSLDCEAVVARKLAPRSRRTIRRFSFLAATRGVPGSRCRE